jgi:hypothetical protein
MKNETQLKFLKESDIQVNKGTGVNMALRCKGLLNREKNL